MKKYFPIGLIFALMVNILSPLLPFDLARARVLAGATAPVSGKAKVLNTGQYLNFTDNSANVVIAPDSGNFSGYGWSTGLGWVAFGTTDNSEGPVKVSLTTGAVSGKAKVLSTGNFIDFTDNNANVAVSLTTGNFSGYAWSTDAGWIDFGDTGVAADIVKPAGVSLVSPTGDCGDCVRPTLVFKKSTSGDVGSYTVELDSGKNLNWSVSGLPATNDASKTSSLWRDDAAVRVEYFYENDGDTDNDEIRVYFKGLDTSELTEGRHSWRVTVEDTAGNSTAETADFDLDRTSPEISELAVVDVSLVGGDGVYRLEPTNRRPAFSGKAADPYRGSEKTNPNGSKDTFDKVSSGPDKLVLTLKKLNGGLPASSPVWVDYLVEEYALSDIQDDLGNEKWVRFFITTPFPLVDGYYQVNLRLKDEAGNSGDYPAFYLSLNYPLNYPAKTSASKNLTTEIIKEEKIFYRQEEVDESAAETLAREGCRVEVTVVDESLKPIGEARVEIHSDPQVGYTDERGVVLFENVPKGEHTIKIAYANFTGEQKVTLEGDTVKEFKFEIRVVEEKTFRFDNRAIIAGAIGLVVVSFLVGWGLKRKKGEK